MDVFGKTQMKLGVTGTHHGLSEIQMVNILGWLQKPFWQRSHILAEFHHGDCVGVDVEVADLIREWHPECKIVCHPPVNEILRGWHESDVILKSKQYLARNRDIVHATDMLIGCPFNRNKSKGGTWYTIKYAMSQNKTVGIFHADGEKEFFSAKHI